MFSKTLCILLSVCCYQGLKVQKAVTPDHGEGVQLKDSKAESEETWNLPPWLWPFGNKTAQIFVINMDLRQDRCRCMKNQLMASPYKIFRQKATTPLDFVGGIDCPGQIFSNGGKPTDSSVKPNIFNAVPTETMSPSNMAIFCSHQHIFQQVNDQYEKPDFVILMEDDLHIKNPSEFWPELQKAVNGEYGYSWDILAVDTVSHFGAHLLIVTTGALPALLTRRMHTVDHYSEYEKSGLKVQFWNPGLVSQMSADLFSDSRPASCEPWVGLGNKVSMDFGWKVKGSEEPIQSFQLECLSA